jgi:uncharacterized protein with NRDE domain
MCLLLFAYKVSDEFPLILAANRDEFYKRPTLPMNFMEQFPDILAGKDMEQGGTWFGLHKDGRFAGLTNYRNPASLKTHAPSRGKIIINFLESGKTPEIFIANLKPEADIYNGFNLILGNIDKLFYFSNVSKNIETIIPGIHGLSNCFLNTPWPKVEQGKKALERALQNKTEMPDKIFEILNDTTIAPDHDLPDTGITPEWERILSARFIKSPIYGTRSSIIMQIDSQKHIRITERTYSPDDTTDYKDISYQIP